MPPAAAPTSPPPESPTLLRVLSRAAVKRTTALLRTLRGTPPHPHWQARAATCATCPIGHRVGKDLYCGKPLLTALHRRPEDGCGCPIVLKAQDPAEHCPVDHRLTPRSDSDGCNCRWCSPNTSQLR